MKSPKVSIIVPVYNSEQYLTRCVESILSQTFTDFEILLVDDESTDNSGEQCDAFALRDNRIHSFHKAHGGAAAARNLALDWISNFSKCDWIACIDSDDWVHPQYLEILINAAMETKTKAVITKFSRVNSYIQPLVIEAPKVEVMSSEELWCRYTVASTMIGAKLIAKELYEGIRYPEGLIHEDEFVTYKMLFKNENISYINEDLYFYYWNENSVMLSKWTTARLVALDAYLEQIQFFYDNKLTDAYRAQCNRFARLCGHSLDDIALYVEDDSERKSLQNKWFPFMKQFIKNHRDQLSLKECPRAFFYMIPGTYYLLSNLRRIFRKKQ